MHEALLNAYVFDYMRKSGFLQTALQFATECKGLPLANTTSKDPVAMTSSELGRSIDTLAPQKQPAHSDSATKASVNGNSVYGTGSPTIIMKTETGGSSPLLPQNQQLSSRHVPAVQVPINTTKGFLFDWWSVFWDAFAAGSDRYPNASLSESIRTYMQHQTQRRGAGGLINVNGKRSVTREVDDLNVDINDNEGSNKRINASAERSPQSAALIAKYTLPRNPNITKDPSIIAESRSEADANSNEPTIPNGPGVNIRPGGASVLSADYTKYLSQSRKVVTENSISSATQQTSTTVSCAGDYGNTRPHRGTKLDLLPETTRMSQNPQRTSNNMEGVPSIAQGTLHSQATASPSNNAEIEIKAPDAKGMSQGPLNDVRRASVASIPLNIQQPSNINADPLQRIGSVGPQQSSTMHSQQPFVLNQQGMPSNFNAMMLGSNSIGSNTNEMLIHGNPNMLAATIGTAGIPISNPSPALVSYTQQQQQQQQQQQRAEFQHGQNMPRSEGIIQGNLAPQQTGGVHPSDQHAISSNSQNTPFQIPHNQAANQFGTDSHQLNSGVYLNTVTQNMTAEQKQHIQFQIQLQNQHQQNGANRLQARNKEEVISGGMPIHNHENSLQCEPSEMKQTQGSEIDQLSMNGPSPGLSIISSPIPAPAQKPATSQIQTSARKSASGHTKTRAKRGSKKSAKLSSSNTAGSKVGSHSNGLSPANRVSGSINSVGNKGRSQSPYSSKHIGDASGVGNSSSSNKTSASPAMLMKTVSMSGNYNTAAGLPGDMMITSGTVGNNTSPVQTNKIMDRVQAGATPITTETNATTSTAGASEIGNDNRSDNPPRGTDVGIGSSIGNSISKGNGARAGAGVRAAAISLTGGNPCVENDSGGTTDSINDTSFSAILSQKASQAVTHNTANTTSTTTQSIAINTSDLTSSIGDTMDISGMDAAELNLGNIGEWFTDGNTNALHDILGLGTTIGGEGDSTSHGVANYMSDIEISNFMNGPGISSALGIPHINLAPSSAAGSNPTIGSNPTMTSSAARNNMTQHHFK